FGVANKWSIAWAIAQALSAAGAQIALTYLDERTEDKVRGLADTLKDPLILPCDVTKDDQIDTVFSKIKHEFGHLDGLIHAIAYARKEELEGSFLKTSRAGFQEALDVSAYSLTALSRAAAPLLHARDGCIVTLSSHSATQAPLQRNIEAEEVAGTALYLCSHLARGVTGEIVYVDAGYNIIGA